MVRTAAFGEAKRCDKLGETVTVPPRNLLLKLFVLLAVGAPCHGQTTPALTFTYRGTTDPTPVGITPGSTLTFPATAAGQSSALQFFVTNNGSSPLQITAASVSPAFGISIAPGGITVQTGQTVQMSLTFTPPSNGSFSTTLTIGASSGSNFLFTLTGTGVSANLITSYQINPGGNQVQVGDGGTIAFPSTQVSLTTTATIVVSNRGSAPGSLTAAVVSGTGFQISGLPLLPVQIAPGDTFQFNLLFAPVQAGPAQGTLQMTLGGSNQKISLTGQGAAASLTYQIIAGSAATSLSPNGTITFPDTPLSQTAAVSIQVSNTGNIAGTLSSITVSGTGFQVSNLPPLPLTLAPAGSTIFTVTFAPVTPGAVTARLTIDSVSFTLSGSGIGAQLTLSFVVGASSTAIVNNGVASFPNTAVGSTTAAVLNIQNTGNATATINSIGVTSPTFGATIPKLPATLAAGSMLSLPLVFAPNSVGPLSGSLTLDSLAITLKGIGTAPPALPTYAFTGVGADQPPMTQPSIGLNLAAPYPSDITGTLTLTFASNSFVDDPTIQFASGGRTVNFTIPANTDTAIFGSGANAVRFQTGTVAGTITITPSFSTANVSLTPLSPPTQSVVIDAGPPVIQNVQLGTVTSSSFEVLISGFSTPRSVSQVNLQFAAAANYSLQSSTLTVNTDSAFGSWYQTTTSGLVGSQFTMSIVIGVNGNMSAVQSVAVTASNKSGTSNTMSVAIH